MGESEANVVGIRGSDVAAGPHVGAGRGVRLIDDGRVGSRTSEDAKRFAQETGCQAMTAENAVRGQTKWSLPPVRS